MLSKITRKGKKNKLYLLFFFNWWIELILENWIRLHNFYNFIYLTEEEESTSRPSPRGRVSPHPASGLWLSVFPDWLDSMLGELEKGEEEDELKSLIISLVTNRI